MSSPAEALLVETSCEMKARNFTPLVVLLPGAVVLPHPVKPHAIASSTPGKKVRFNLELLSSCAIEI